MFMQCLQRSEDGVKIPGTEVTVALIDPGSVNQHLYGGYNYL